MMSLEQIRAESRKAAARAARRRVEPFTVEAEDIEDFRAGASIPFPFIGDYTPRGWRKAGKPLFCDASGFGGDNGPALTVDKLCDRLKVGRGYAVIEVGQFQVYVQEYVRVCQ